MAAVLRLCVRGSCYCLQGASHLVNTKKCVLVRYRNINMRNLNSVVQVLVFEVLILLNHMNATEKRFCRLPL